MLLSSLTPIYFRLAYWSCERPPVVRTGPERAREALQVTRFGGHPTACLRGVDGQHGASHRRPDTGNGDAQHDDLHIRWCDAAGGNEWWDDDAVDAHDAAALYAADWLRVVLLEGSADRHGRLGPGIRHHSPAGSVMSSARGDELVGCRALGRRCASDAV